jgi:transposase
MMDKKNQLTSAQRNTIICSYKKKTPYRDIAKQVSCSKSTVGVTIRRFLETGSAEPQGVRTGRPLLINSSSQAILKKITKKNRRLCASKLTNLFVNRTKVDVSTSTIRRALYDLNLKCRVARPKPLISEVNSENRLDWCRQRSPTSFLPTIRFEFWIGPRRALT